MNEHLNGSAVRVARNSSAHWFDYRRQKPLQTDTLLWLSLVLTKHRFTPTSSSSTILFTFECPNSLAG